ncbi:MAG: hypothetical protein ACLPKB_29745 [Xanthobacteraceae bacterium]
MRQFGGGKFVALVLGALLSWGVGGFFASAADLIPLKAPPEPPPVLDIHGFIDATYQNDYITPRGLLVHGTGLDTQVAAGLIFDLYKDKTGFINDVSFYTGVWNDLWSEQHDPHVGAWNEFDWWVGTNVVFAKNWTFGVQYIEFIPPAADLSTSFPSTERNIEFSLLYDDTSWGWPISIHPYVKLFYEVIGPSTVVMGQRGNIYDVEVGVVPTLDLKKYTGVPLVLTAPTWITVGPTDYWNRNDGTTNFCGPLGSLPAGTGSPCSLSNFGVFTTGLQAKLALDSIVPKRLGNWYIKGGARYYHIINDALLAAQEFTAGASGIAGVNGTFPQAHRDVGVVFAGLGFAF